MRAFHSRFSPAKVVFGALSAALMLSLAAPAANANQPGQPDRTQARCEAGQTGCPQPPHHKKDAQKADKRHDGAQPQGAGHQNGKPQGKKPQEHRAENRQRPPHEGDSARGAPPLQRAQNSRLPAPPKNQHYRVLNERVVRVDDKTMKVVAVIGLVSDILN